MIVNLSSRSRKLNMNDLKLHAVILAGGESRRMGRSKAWLTYHNEPQVLRLYNMLCTFPTLEKVWININEWPSEGKILPIIEDTINYRNHGPISGILSAYDETNRPLLVMGCDYPLLDAKEIQKLLLQRNRNAKATVFRNEQGFYEPLFGIYEKEGLELLKHSFDNGNDSLHSFLTSIEVNPLKDFSQEVFKSVDTPEDYVQILKYLETNSTF